MLSVVLILGSSTPAICMQDQGEEVNKLEDDLFLDCTGDKNACGSSGIGCSILKGHSLLMPW